MKGSSGLPRSARNYIGCVTIVAVMQSALFAVSIQRGQYHGAIPHEQVLIAVLVFSVLAVIAGIKPINMPAGDQSTVVSSVLVASILLVGPEYAVIPAVVQVVGTHIIQHRPFQRLLFNVSQFALTVGLSGLLYYEVRMGFRLPTDPARLSGVVPDSLKFNSLASVAALAIFMVAYFVLNTGLVATRGRPDPRSASGDHIPSV